MKNYTSNPLNTLYDVLKVADVIMTQVRNCTISFKAFI